jgi:enterochelin esterase-like enzyme
MRRMITRQAKTLLASLLALFTVLTACSSPTLSVASPTNSRATNLPTIDLPADLSPTPTLTPTAALTPTPTPLACLTQPGRIEEESLDSFKPAQEFLVYLPPCYDEQPDKRYPVLYLLHGQTYTDDQWIRLGVARVLDQLIQAGDVQPFIIVFPDDRYWNLQAGSGFGKRLIENVIPYIDANYRTLADRDHRAIGGLSRGAGWSLRLGLADWKMFGAIGLHSLAVMQQDLSRVDGWLADIPPASRPNIFMDIGDNDQELSLARQVETIFNGTGLTHEWHLYSGAHTETYWGAHVEEYIRWYADQWDGTQ